MASRTIHFSESIDKFMFDHKDATGTSIQRFVTIACENYKYQIQVNQAIRDYPLDNAEVNVEEKLKEFNLKPNT